MGRPPIVTPETVSHLALEAFTMPGLTWWQLFWLCQTCFALRYKMNKPEDATEGLTWQKVAAACAAIPLVALGLKWLRRTVLMEKEEAEEVPLCNEEDLEGRILQSFSQMEQDLVQMLTEVRRQKSTLSARHRSCKNPECQCDGDGSNDKAFNVVVYDIVEEDSDRK